MGEGTEQLYVKKLTKIFGARGGISAESWSVSYTHLEVYKRQVLGPVHPAVEDQTGAVGMKVVSVAGHDSASAVAAIPGFGKNKLYVCLGTNANMGVETDRPDISDCLLYTSRCV